MLSRVNYYFLVILTVFLVGEARANEIVPQSVPLDGQIYEGTRRQMLINSFISVSAPTQFVFSSSSDFSFPQESVSFDFFNSESIKRNYPWLYPYLYESKIPPLLSVNKWVKPIRISLDLPNNYQSFGEENKAFGYYLGSWGTNSPRPEYLSARSWVQAESSRTASELSRLTGHDIKFVAEEPLNDPLAVSNVRVVLMDNVKWWSSKFKIGGKQISANLTNWGHSWLAIEPFLITRIPFTPGNTRQVEGYFISNERNEIQFAVCYIWSGHEKTLLQKLVQECLVRSLGLPGSFDIKFHQPVSFFGFWNGMQNPSVWDVKAKKMIEYPVIFLNPENMEKPTPYELELSDIDKFFVKTLYSPAIKPGATYVDLYNLLAANGGR